MNISSILENYDYLQKAIQYIIENNGESTFNPYHNLNHNLTVLYFTHYVGVTEKLAIKELKELHLAAIFHDFQHSGGKKTDAENIEMAKAGVKDFVDKNEIDVDVEAINNILDATQYPYVIDNSDLNTQQKIIRDADLMQLFEPTRIQSNILGLGKEIGVPYGQMLENQKKFVSGVEFLTETAKYVKNKSWSEIEAELDLLIKINKNNS